MRGCLPTARGGCVHQVDQASCIDVSHDILSVVAQYHSYVATILNQRKIGNRVRPQTSLALGLDWTLLSQAARQRLSRLYYLLRLELFHTTNSSSPAYPRPHRSTASLSCCEVTENNYLHVSAPHNSLSTSVQLVQKLVTYEEPRNARRQAERIF